MKTGASNLPEAVPTAEVPGQYPPTAKPSPITRPPNA